MISARKIVLRIKMTTSASSSTNNKKNFHRHALGMTSWDVAVLGTEHVTPGLLENETLDVISVCRWIFYTS